MKNAGYNNKELIVDILTESFQDNQSVNYIAKRDEKRLKRIEALMDYSFDVCNLFGDVFLSDDNKACALVLYPDKKKTTLKSIMLDAKLILLCVGIENIKKTLDREAMIKKIQPKEPMYYLWFIGVDPAYQHTGIGSEFLKEIIEHAKEKQRPIYLETSTVRNLPWYKKFGFTIYQAAELSYKLYFLKKV
ncbi:acetyltransferase (GNAT) family protein [Arcticibacter tournemirensis]|uniref:GNAT family N-acetyltransferase n=1 Tax=Arcticibacter tournemirensis TaxID=699437 RepID=A0A5M9GR88_9SPHI|nr:GNAT family N-acetyltransferase [Arcticibacter tournemirensis]KAA8476870.1 GNAT family N-acetyltransferase [Arcticibacter tournemirensis]TQM49559.1 acetyltransferase (GNAT) family protein [Arcticibacter tournemirensis]